MPNAEVITEIPLEFSDISGQKSFKSRERAIRTPPSANWCRKCSAR